MARPSVATTICLLALGVLVQAQDPQQPVFRSRLETVAVPVTVFDPDGDLVTELTRDDFTVLDNGKPQDITTFSSGLQPIRAVALVDNSASMAPVLDLALASAEQFVDRLRPDDKARVGVFSLHTWLSPDFTADRDALVAWLHRDQPWNNPTAILDAVNEAITDLTGENGRRVVVVFTDGCDTASTTGWSTILNRIRAEDVMVYAVMFQPHLAVKPPEQHTIGFGAAARARPGPMSGPLPPCTLHHWLELSNASPPKDFLKVDDPRWTRGAALVDQLASETGGGRVLLTPAEETNRLFTHILDELHYLYLLGFTPQKLDGKVHELTVKLKDAKLVVRARQHYVAPVRAGAGPGGL
ncbi:MAG TPA: VWA domain-containing protein [Vicinamibacterales bacterium]|nr:VWA domain-containing protein [Vicinamibacterales bacterium]